MKLIKYIATDPRLSPLGYIWLSVGETKSLCIGEEIEVSRNHKV